MKKVLILGSCGAGKSTLARALSEKTKLPIIHLDQEYWKPNWVETPKEEWEAKVKELCHTDSFIMDGNYGGTLEYRLKHADTAIFIKTPTYLNLWRVIKRTWKYHGTERPDMPKGCKERWDWDFLHYVLLFNHLSGKKAMKKIKDASLHTKIVILNGQREVDKFLLN